MRRLVFAAFAVLHLAVACFVPTFDVDSTMGGKGGTGALSGNGGANALGGDNGPGATGGSKTAGGTNSIVPNGGGGKGGSAGEGALGGAGGGQGGEGTAGPMRVGFSVFHDSAFGNDNASSKLADATFSKPPGTATGDLMLVFFGCDHQLMNLDGNHLDPSGWKLEELQEGYGEDGQGIYLLYKFVDENEPDQIVFADINPVGSGNGVQGLLSVYRGVNATAPINAYEVARVDVGSKSAKRIVTATPAITTTVDDCLLIAGLSPDTAVDAPAIAFWPDGFVENQVSVNNPSHPYPYGWANIYSAERHLAHAGTVPASAFTWDMTYGGSEYYGSFSFVLALAP